MAITNSQLSASGNTNVFVSSGENAVTALIFCNTSNSTDADINIWMVPNGFAAGDNNKIVHEVFLGRGETFSIDTEKFILGSGDSIVASATQNSIITATVSYIQLF
jgi:hypothetical protein